MAGVRRKQLNRQLLRPLTTANRLSGIHPVGRTKADHRMVGFGSTVHVGFPDARFYPVPCHPVCAAGDFRGFVEGGRPPGRGWETWPFRRLGGGVTRGGVRQKRSRWRPACGRAGGNARRRRGRGNVSSKGPRTSCFRTNFTFTVRFNNLPDSSIDSAGSAQLASFAARHSVIGRLRKWNVPVADRVRGPGARRAWPRTPGLL